MIHAFAGHGIEIDGLQCLILNELDEDDSSFCKVYKAELEIRTLAAKFPASYHIAIFGCKNFTNVLIDLSEKDGSTLVSPRSFNQQIPLNVAPSSQFIRMQGISAKQRQLANHEAE